MDKQPERTPRPSTLRRRGQTLVEFALTLPILLLLLFGIIEFARIFQAWVTLQNAARTAARYAITGNVDQNHLEALADEVAINMGDAAGAALPDTRLKLCQDGDNRGSHTDFNPYSNGYESLFANHWDGLNCEPGSEEHQGLLNDMGRIFSIRDQARVGAAGLDLRITGQEAYEIETDVDGNFMEWTNGDQPGWFHVFICSTRLTLRENDDPSVVRYGVNRDDLLCTVQEWRGPVTGLYHYTDDAAESVNNYNLIQWDAGGPGDTVEIIVTFNHPLITPLALPTYVQLQARRAMVNEAFRASRVVNLPPVVGQPTNTPSNTPQDTSTPEDTPTFQSTDTPTPSDTPTATGTPTPSPTPDCSMIYLAGVNFNGPYLQVSIRNDNFAPVELQGVDLRWRKHALFPDMYVDNMRWKSDNFWDGTDSTPPSVVSDGLLSGSEPTWNTSADVTLDGNSTQMWQVRFANGPFDMDTYYNQPDFTGTVWYFSNGCTVSIDDPEPTPPDEPPTDTPEPICGDYTLNFEAFWPQGVVQFSILNFGDTPIRIEGINMHWVNYFSGMNLDFVSIGGVNAFDPASIKVWDGNGTGSTVGAQTTTPMGTYAGGSDPNWLINATVNPGDTVFMWLDFDGTSVNLQTEYDALDTDFNGTAIAFDNGCNTEQDIPTPIPPYCGDGIRQSDLGEECDNGANNGRSNNSCDANCQYVCGNNQIDADHGETCDDGNRNDGDGCSRYCRIEECGDGIRQSSLGEQCDDGNTSNGDGCSSTCQNECGNGRVDPGEQCDDGNTQDRDECRNSCQWSVCGDRSRADRPNNHAGIVEQCDDGNTRNGDGCSSTCQNEPPVCGNGRTESGEQCDDGNTNNGDGCSSTCQIEPRCGDGSVNQGSEECDDGNTRNNDGCSSTCQIEETSGICGDGTVDEGEECDWGSGNVPVGQQGCNVNCQLDMTGTG
jgi:cysteine-rich repeat protein